MGGVVLKWAEKRGNLNFWGGKKEDRKKTGEIAPIFRFVADFGAILGTEKGPKCDQKRYQKKKKKHEKGQKFSAAGGFDGLAEAAGR